MSPEIRTYKTALEMRAAGPDSPGIGTLHGYAAKFHKQSRDLGGFVEQIAPSAFAKTLADGARVMARYNHDDMALLGTTDAGTLRLSVDEIGLRYEVDLPDTSFGRDVSALAQRGDLHLSSFAFMVPKDGDEWGFTDSDYPLRTLRSVRLIDVAPVNDPAYLDTSSGLRSLAEARGLDVDAVRDAAARRDLRALLKSDLDAPAEPAVQQDETQTPTEPQARSLDDARRRLDLLRLAR